MYLDLLINILFQQLRKKKDKSYMFHTQLEVFFQTKFHPGTKFN